ncbi:hypothetical protein AKJ16_DCAP16367 [Drosera capensis]
MRPIEYRAVLKYRKMVPLFAENSVCPCCRQHVLDVNGDHAVHCANSPGVKNCHDTIRDVLYDTCQKAGIQSRKEAEVTFLSEGGRLRPADVLLFNWEQGRHSCVDVTCVSPMAHPSGGKAAEDAAVGKVKKHEEGCRVNEHTFIPFATDTALAKDAVTLLNRISKVANANAPTPNQHKPEASPRARWSPPPPDWIKINVDVAVNERRLVCIAAVVRDSMGTVKGASGKTIVGIVSPQVGEGGGYEVLIRVLGDRFIVNGGAVRLLIRRSSSLIGCGVVRFGELDGIQWELD